MLTSILLALFLGSAQPGPLHVKVIGLDSDKASVTLLLPMHNTELETHWEKADGQDQLRIGNFYRSKPMPGELGTRTRNRLIIHTKNGPVVLIIRAIRFR